ncbi:hypothetical protein Fot_41777 [Forsythia ovata]
MGGIEARGEHEPDQEEGSGREEWIEYQGRSLTLISTSRKVTLLSTEQAIFMPNHRTQETAFRTIRLHTDQANQNSISLPIEDLFPISWKTLFAALSLIPL